MSPLGWMVLGGIVAVPLSLLLLWIIGMLWLVKHGWGP